MKLVALGNPLDSDHFGSIDKSSEIQAAAHSQTIDECRAAATEALAAAFSPSEQTEITAQHIEPRKAPDKPRYLTDQELVAKFPKGSCFIAEVDGKKELVFLDPKVKRTYVARSGAGGN